MPIRRHALLAGVLYLLLVLVAPVRLVYIQNTLFAGDATTVAAQIVLQPGLFRLGILTDLFCATLEVFLTLALYQLFRTVDRRAAVLMAVLGLMPVPLYFANAFNDIAIAHLVLGPAPVSGFDPAQVAALVDLASHLHAMGVHVLQIFWGAWLLPLALLAWKAPGMPRPVAAWLGVNAVAYLALSVAGLAAPQWNATVAMLAVPAQLGEVAFTACLLWHGLRRRRAPAAPVFADADAV